MYEIWDLEKKASMLMLIHLPSTFVAPVGTWGLSRECTLRIPKRVVPRGDAGDSSREYILRIPSVS